MQSAGCALQAYELRLDKYWGPFSGPRQEALS